MQFSTSRIVTVLNNPFTAPQLENIPEGEVTITYTSSNPNVATIDEQGVVNILETGETIITATTSDNLNTAEYELIVLTDVSRQKLYKKMFWQNGITKLNAENLNRIENGIDAIDQQLANLISHFDISGLSGNIDFDDYVLKSRTIADLSLENDISISALAQKLGLATPQSGGVVDISSLKDITDKLVNSSVKIVLVNKFTNWEITIYESDANKYDSTLAAMGFNAEDIETYKEVYPRMYELKIAKNLLLDLDILANYSLIQFDIVNNLDIQDYFIDEDSNYYTVNFFTGQTDSQIYTYEVDEAVNNTNYEDSYILTDINGEEVYIHPIGIAYNVSETYYKKQAFNFRMQLWFTRNEEE